MKLIIGDVFSIKTKNGFGFLQYFETDDLNIQQVRVLDKVSFSEEINQSEIDKAERWLIGFPLKTAFRRKIVNRIGNFNLPIKFKNPNYRRSSHIIPRKADGWHIIDLNSSKMQFKEKLTKKELKYSPHGVFNDTLIIEYLEEDWRLENWK